MLGVAALYHGAHGDAVFGEHARHRGEHARTVGHSEADVVLRLQLLHRKDGQVIGASAAHDGGNAQREMARHLEHVAHDGARRRARARALAEKHRLAHSIARHVNRIEHAVHRRELMRLREHRGVHAHVDAVGRAMGDRQKLDDVTHVVGGFQIERRDVADALGVHVVERDA